MMEKFVASALLALSCIFGLGAEASAAERLQFQISSSLGVVAHHPSASELAAMAQAGVRVVRTDIFWDSTEKQPGVYDWTSYKLLAQTMRSLGIRPYFILDYGNKLHAQGEAKEANGEIRPFAPATDAERLAFAKWAASAVHEFAAYDPIWEIWNEPEHDGFWPPKADAQSYVRLALETCHMMREAEPSATIVGPAAARVPTAEDPSPIFLSAILKTPLVSCLDAVSVHPYLPNRQMETTHWMWTRLRTMIAAAAGHGSRPDVISGEWGLSTVNAYNSPRQQAAYLVKMLTLDAADKIPISIWYDWRNDGDDPFDNESNFGLVAHDEEPKPALSAFSNFAKRLSGTDLVCRSPASENSLQTFAFKGASQPETWLVSWVPASGLPPIQRLTLPEGLEAEVIFDFTGGLIDTQSRAVVDIATTPVFIRVPLPNANEARLLRELCRSIAGPNGVSHSDRY